MDLVVGCKKVIVTTMHCSKSGKSKILKACTLPLTGHNVASMIVTEKAVFLVDNGCLQLIEIAPGLTVDDVRACTDATFLVNGDVAVMRQ